MTSIGSILETEERTVRSDYLFAKPSFIRGMGRTFDPWGTPEPYNWSPTSEEAEAIAASVDWDQVAQDVSRAMKLLSQELAGADETEQLHLFKQR